MRFLKGLLSAGLVAAVCFLGAAPEASATSKIRIEWMLTQPPTFQMGAADSAPHLLYGGQALSTTGAVVVQSSPAPAFGPSSFGGYAAVTGLSGALVCTFDGSAPTDTLLATNGVRIAAGERKLLAVQAGAVIGCIEALDQPAVASGGGGVIGVVQYNSSGGNPTNVSPSTPLPVSDPASNLPIPAQTAPQVDVGAIEQIRVAPIASTAAESCHVFKASSATVYSLSGYAGQAEFFMLFNSASVPADGAVTPVWWGYASAAGPWGVTFPNPEMLPSGAVLCASTVASGPFTKAAISTSNAFSGQVQ